MNKKTTLSLLVLGSMFSGMATAATSANSLAVLNALDALTVDTTWIRANSWPGLDSSVDADGIAWGALDGSDDPCVEGWAGIICSGAEITHIELPNAKMTGTLGAVFAAIAPIKAQLVSINFSSTTDVDANTLTGGIPDTADGQDYAALKYLALNKVGATGEIPNLSSYSALVLANFYDNDFTIYTGPVGGASLSLLRLYDNENLTGDLAETITAATGLSELRSDDTLLTGGIDVVTDVTLTAGVTAKTIDIIWTPAAVGLTPASYTVEYTSNDGSTWTELPLVTTGNTVTTAVLANGTYGAKITPNATEGFHGAAAFPASSIIISDSGTTEGSGSGTGSGEETDTGTDSGTTSSGSSSGGGAALWLLALPLLGRFRR